MARQRRKVFVDTNNHDRWIVSYADFITLLFAFFVVMYSISSVNEGKYKTLTDSLGTAFSSKEQQKKAINAVVQKKPVLAVGQATPLTIPFEHKALPKQTIGIAEQAWELAAIPDNELDLSTISQIQPFSKTGQQTLSNALAVAFDSAKSGDQFVANQVSQQESIMPSDKAKAEPVELAVNIGQESMPELLNVPFESTVPENLTMPEDEKKRELSEEILKERKQLNQVSDQLEQSLAPFIKDDLIAIKRNDYWIELEMNSELLFLSGEAALSPKAQPACLPLVMVNSTPLATMPQKKAALRTGESPWY
ncbi:hypothetical protein MCAMS1_01005 [biofilm metagenome]